MERGGVDDQRVELDEDEGLLVGGAHLRHVFPISLLKVGFIPPVPVCLRRRAGWQDAKGPTLADGKQGLIHFWWQKGWSASEAGLLRRPWWPSRWGPVAERGGRAWRGPPSPRRGPPPGGCRAAQARPPTAAGEGDGQT